MNKKKFVVCCSKLWDPQIAQKLQKTTGHEFILVEKKAELNPGFLSEIKPDSIFFPHWSYIIPPEIHRNFRSIIFHMTDLPYGRGGSPLQNLIVRGHEKTKMSALICTDGLDEGDILLKKDLELSGSAEEIFKRATALIEQMIVEIIATNPTPQPQQGEVTLFKRRTPTDSDLSLCKTEKEVYDLIRMVDSDLYPRAFLKTPQGVTFEFSEAALGENGVTAKVRIKNEIQ